MRSRKSSRGSRRDTLLLLFFIVPALVWVISLVFFPLVWTIWLSFTETVLGHELIGKFQGLTNYIALLFEDPDFPIVMWNSLVWTVGNLAVSGAIGLGAALLLNEVFPGRTLLRALVVIPWVIPSVATTISWRWMLNSEFGVIQKIMLMLGLMPEPIAFFGRNYAMMTVILVNAWRFTPFVTLVYLAALEGIPKQLYEAAGIDGASPFQKFKNVTLPYLKPTFVVLGLIGVLLTYGYFDVIWLTTKGGPGTTTTIPPVYVWISGFYEFSLSKAAAISVIMAIVVITFALLYLKFFAEETS
jgi:multiple sugar transport system permease protein